MSWALSESATKKIISDDNAIQRKYSGVIISIHVRNLASRTSYVF